MLRRPLPSLLVATLSILASSILTTSSVTASGLLVPDRPGDPALTIQDHLVSVRITDQVALTTINQTFYNDSDQRLEATYIFPIPDGADLTDFQMTFNGKMVEGEVLPVDEARAIYESIVRRRRDPGLIEFIGRRLLRARVFPIEPKSTTEIQIEYQQVLSPVSEMWRYHYPLRTPGSNSRAHGTVRFAVDIDSTEPLKAIWSPSHEVEVVRDGDHAAKVAFEKNSVNLDEDFTLLFDTESSDVGMSLVSYKGDGDDEDGHFLLLLSPKHLWDENEKIAQDYVFVLDTSGSMAGEKIEQAKQALSFCVDRLEPEDRFSIVRFSTGYDTLFDELKHADGDAKAAAKRMIGKFKSSGGTNIHDALRAAIEIRNRAIEPQDVVLEVPGHAAVGQANNITMTVFPEARPFVLVFITDGRGDGGRGDVMDMLDDELGDATEGMHIFPFGVGHDVNTKLLDSLSGEYHGLPTYVQPGENLEYVLGDFFSVFSEPVLTDLNLKLPDVGISDLFPPKPGDLYHGRQVVLTGRFSDVKDGQIVLTARRGDEKLRYVWDNVRFDPLEDATYVSRIWAGRKIAYLLDRIRLHGETPEMVDEVTQLAMTHGIQTPYTAWLVAPESERQGIRTETLSRNRGRTDDFFGNPEGGSATGFRQQRAGGGRGNFFQDDNGVEGGPARESFPALRSVEQTQEMQDLFDVASEDEDLTAWWTESQRGEEVPLVVGGRVLQSDAIDATFGEAAVRVSKLNADLRDGQTTGAGAIPQNMRTVRTINKREYLNFRGVLVDAKITEEHDVITVKFGSDAYFDLVMARSDLRKVLAASPYVLLIVNDTTVVAVRPDKGIESFEGEENADAKAKVFK